MNEKPVTGIAVITWGQQLTMPVLREALQNTGLPPRNLHFLLTDQGLDLSPGARWWSMRVGADYWFCNAHDEVQARAVFRQYLTAIDGAPGEHGRTPQKLLLCSVCSIPS